VAGSITVRSPAPLTGMQRCHSRHAGSHRPPEPGRSVKPSHSQCFPGWDMDDVAVGRAHPGRFLREGEASFQVSLARLQLLESGQATGWLDVKRQGVLVPVPGSREIGAGRSPVPLPLLGLACHAGWNKRGLNMTWSSVRYARISILEYVNIPIYFVFFVFKIFFLYAV